MDMGCGVKLQSYIEMNNTRLDLYTISNGCSNLSGEVAHTTNNHYDHNQLQLLLGAEWTDEHTKITA